MTATKPQFNFKKVSFALASVSALLLMTPAVKATESPINQSVSPETTTFQIAQSNRCLSDLGEGFTAVTRNFNVGICYTQNGAYYVGRSRTGTGSLLLPLSSQRGNVYVARNGRYTYTLNMNSRQLIITLPNGRRSIEPVIRVIDS